MTSTLSQQVPYRGAITRDGASVYSGPGAVHYSTDRLALGTVVDVYRHDPGGWCAIRPPDGSFSLVLAADVEIIDEDTARVVNEGAQAWVGTQLDAVESPLWQVRLKQDEVVDVLGFVDAVEQGVQADQPQWIQILPPAGEFRWVRAEDLEPTGDTIELELPSPTGVADSAVAAPLARSVNSSSREARATRPGRGAGVQVESMTQSRPGVSGWQKAQLPLSHFLNDSNRRSPAALSQQSPQQWSQDSISDASNPSAAAPNPPAVTVPDNSVPIDDPVQQLDLQLTREVLQAPGQWRLNELAAQVHQLFAQSNDPVQRTGCQHLLAKIQRFQQVQSGLDLPGQGMPPRVSSSSGADIAGAQVNPGLDLPIGDITPAAHYDATGWLNELVRDRGLGESSYVLQDEQGNITHHIMPSPGVNLHRYLKKKVGVIGQRGFHQELNLSHVTAERVVDLDRLRR